MQTLSKQLVASPLRNRVISEAQLRRVIDGSDQRRYHMVNRAMAAGELVRLRRGRYVLADALRDCRPHPFALAQAFDAGSYVSFETALAHHGWIPEAVRSVASVSPGRKSSTHHHEAFGSFSFHPLALRSGGFLVLVDRLERDGQVALVARPARALADLVCLRKEAWQGLRWIVESLRIDADVLRTITGAEIRALQEIYSQQRVRTFLARLAKELGND